MSKMLMENINLLSDIVQGCDIVVLIYESLEFIVPLSDR